MSANSLEKISMDTFSAIFVKRGAGREKLGGGDAQGPESFKPTCSNEGYYIKTKQRVPWILWIMTDTHETKVG